MKEEQIIAKVKEVFKDELQGMTGTDDCMIIALKNKEITINDIETKSIDEIIEEIKQSI